jgi:sugar O-acyltransferase (sialic acid O-acetyltransferase NeuD family)
MIKNLIIVGAGGAASEAMWVCARINLLTETPSFRIIGLTDDNPERTGENFEGSKIIGTSSQLVTQFQGEKVYFFCAIGQNRARERVSAFLETAGFDAASLIDPSAIIAPTAQIGLGSYIGPMSIVAPHARIGRHVLINTHVGVGHHSVIGDFVQLCPGVRVNGGCKIDKGALLGSNVSVHPRLTIGESATVGANSFVIRSVKPRFSVLGVPARIVSRPAENGLDAQA